MKATANGFGFQECAVSEEILLHKVSPPNTHLEKRRRFKGQGRGEIPV